MSRGNESVLRGSMAPIAWRNSPASTMLVVSTRGGNNSHQEYEIALLSAPMLTYHLLYLRSVCTSASQVLCILFDYIENKYCILVRL